ncbi:MAG TPA: hypothetical protein DIW24_01600 [Bacteroidetes bacterium]|nr:hypothetical protein [Bacteroidota bacterium]HRR07363.1 hypothetical protein [Rhodothermales bacterium]
MGHTPSWADKLRLWYLMQRIGFREIFAVLVVTYIVGLVVLLLPGLRDVYFQAFVLAPGISWLTPLQLVTHLFVNPLTGLFGLISFFFLLGWFFIITQMSSDFAPPHRLVGQFLGGGVFAGIIYWLVATFVLDQGGAVYGAHLGIIAVAFSVAHQSPTARIPLFFFEVPFWVMAFLILVLYATMPGGLLGGAAAAAFGWGTSELAKRGVDVHSWARVFFSPVRKPVAPRPPVRREPALSHYSIPDRKSYQAKETHKTEKNTEKPDNEIIDRLLDKINEQGYESLTPEEKQALYDASKK